MTAGFDPREYGVHPQRLFATIERRVAEYVAAGRMVPRSLQRAFNRGRAIVRREAEGNAGAGDPLRREFQAAQDRLAVELREGEREGEPAGGSAAGPPVPVADKPTDETGSKCSTQARKTNTAQRKPAKGRGRSRPQ